MQGNCRSLTELVEGESCYYGIFDLASAANQPGKWEDEFQAAKEKAGSEEWSALFHLNQSWIDLAGQGELLSWITLFDGVFKVEIRILGEQAKFEFGEEAARHFLGERKENLLNCRSGKIIVESLTRLGSTSLIPLITITPGRYRVAFVRNDDEEIKHQCLDDRSLYSDDEGPDWKIYMQRLSSLARIRG